MPQPLMEAGLPVPAIVNIPSMKSSGTSGQGMGLQRNGSGGVSMPQSAPNVLIQVRSAIRRDGSCTTEGRMR